MSYYQGQGRQRPEMAGQLPPVSPTRLRDPEHYLAGAELAAAVDVALTLGMPLLLTGEPGLGKSLLAHSIAWELRLGEEEGSDGETHYKPLTFPVKSDTQGRDLFYTFDTVGRFHASQSNDDDADPRRFLTFNALGRAILLARPKDETMSGLLGPALDWVGHPGPPRRSVVLIDEIDKAPRDVPNDILNEIEEIAFRIPEIAATLEREGHRGQPEFRLENDAFRPIVVITSNSEKGLPDPFLRRCVYHHLSFPKFRHEAGDPEGLVTVERIVERRLGDRYAGGGEELVREAVALFELLRRRNLGYRPSLAELLNWLDYLLPAQGVRGAPLGRLREIGRARLLGGLNLTLLKNERAQGALGPVLDEWLRG